MKTSQSRRRFLEMVAAGAVGVSSAGNNLASPVSNPRSQIGSTTMGTGVASHLIQGTYVEDFESMVAGQRIKCGWLAWTDSRLPGVAVKAGFEGQGLVDGQGSLSQQFTTPVGRHYADRKIGPIVGDGRVTVTFFVRVVDPGQKRTGVALGQRQGTILAHRGWPAVGLFVSQETGNWRLRLEDEEVTSAGATGVRQNEWYEGRLMLDFEAKALYGNFREAISSQWKHVGSIPLQAPFSIAYLGVLMEGSSASPSANLDNIRAEWSGLPYKEELNGLAVGVPTATASFRLRASRSSVHKAGIFLGDRPGTLLGGPTAVAAGLLMDPAQRTWSLVCQDGTQTIANGGEVCPDVWYEGRLAMDFRSGSVEAFVRPQGKREWIRIGSVPFKSQRYLGRTGTVGEGDGTNIVDIRLSSAPPEARRATGKVVSGYETTVPDTLDLAYRAELGLNGITGIIDPKTFEMYAWTFFNKDRPYMLKWMGAYMCLMSKCLETLPMLRVMTGNNINKELEAGLARLIRSSIRDDGIFWCPASPERPWHNASVDYASPYGQIRTLRAMMLWYQYTGEVSWKELGDRLVNGMDHMAIHKNDYAYFPSDGPLGNRVYMGDLYVKAGWTSDREPKNERDSAQEGSVFMGYGTYPGALALWYQMTGNKKALRLAGEFARFLTKRKLWGVPNDPSLGVDHKGNPLDPLLRGAERAHWDGHWHGHMQALRALLDYAIVTHDTELKEFVRAGYEWSRNRDFANIGWFDPQGCGTPRIVGLAIKLSEAGIGDYWEDVDRYVRNNMVEAQMTDPTLLENIAGTRPEHKVVLSSSETQENVTRRSIGDFVTNSSPTEFLDGFFHGAHLCCIPWGNMGLFFAWDSIVRYQDEVARVNLLLNRASPWLDVDSYLPYEGKVVIRNKKARILYVRIPLWVEAEKVRCQVGNNLVNPRWFGRYLFFQGLAPRGVITLTFPVTERVEKFGQFTARFRGNTVVDISPRIDSDSYPGYLRAHLLNDQAPMKQTVRYVTDKVLLW